MVSASGMLDMVWKSTGQHLESPPMLFALLGIYSATSVLGDETDGRELSLPALPS